MRDQVRSGGEDVAGGAVVAFEADDLRAGKVVVETQDVVDLRAAPAIDRLIVVADAADVFRGRLLPLPACGVATIGARAESVGVRGGLQQLGLRRFPLT